MKTARTFLALLTTAVILSPAAVWALPFRVGQLPNGNLITCSACHINPAGGGARNLFGQTVERNFLNSGNVVWGPALASLDSDGDGVTNGMELQDPHGLWTAGQPAPGIPSLVTRPGVAAENQLRALAVQFENMTPHVGQRLGLRVVDEATGKETGRQTVAAIGGPSFNVSLDAATPGGSYRVDFFADLSGNGLYDAPPTDHAWRLRAHGVAQDTTLAFSHNTDFKDIHWVYALTVNFHGMTPHLGQLVEARVIDAATQAEVGRGRVVVVPGADFSLVIPGLEANGSYNLEFYADVNRNGRFDGTPTDHAWRVAFTNPEGDATVEFTHNTNFAAIEWRYAMALSLLGMQPHVGQRVELRVVHEGTGTEVGRMTLDTLRVANPTITISGLQLGQNYRADFYADLNGNGMYDAPPVDHAWRVTFTAGTGDVVLNFQHNTNFTDIQWPTEPSGVEPGTGNGLARGYALHQNYPNPFNPQTVIAFELPVAGPVTLTVFDLTGREVAGLVHGALPAGRHTAVFEAGDLPSGMYFYRLQAGGFSDVKRLVLMK